MADRHYAILSSIFDPLRLSAVHALYFAWADSSGLSDAASLLHLFSNNVAAPIYDLCFTTALEPLSNIPLSEISSLLPYLPVPTAPEFPVQALGLHLLLDQVPRLLLSGIDERWTFGHFAPLTMRLAQELAALPMAVQPQRIQRWRDLGYNFEGAWLRAFMLWTAFIHDESQDMQRFGQCMIEEECRRGAEAHYGIVDPTRALDETDDRDLPLYPRLRGEVKDGVGKDGSREEGIWMLCRIVRAHEPIIRFFGKYPSRNGAMGREEAEGEAEFLRRTGNFEVSDPETTRRVRDDVMAGRWTPLQTVRSE